ncbi:F-box/FBD/LRR-repeat protein At1g13570 [Elaeis guineensis]|uniref:F-box/FBD/LRR-repeat protein At1g13570 n=1 Tax=Elaeis guineensis var. tenera TaxID=51953 RepID=A0A6I9RUF1_ELAGV|nr:F-box/FBD/LRR-repeat protein At1g13570 [Elaeis guineensis]
MTSTLPDPILQSFQSLWISATNIDFGPELSSSRTPEEFVASVNHVLQNHKGKKLNRFRLFFCPLDMFLPDIENWIAFAVAKGVEELELDLSMGSDPLTGELTNGGHPLKLPDCLFKCKSLTNLSLSHCDFCPPPDFSGFNGLQSLSLSYVSIADDMLHFMVANCPLLDSLSLKSCQNLNSIKVSGEDIQIQRLTVIQCWDAWEMEVRAPRLRSFIYYGEHIFGDSSLNIPSLEDAFISSIDMERTEPEHDYIKLLFDLSHVKILTVCTATLMRFTIYEEFLPEDLPVLLPNLRELQLLIDLFRSEELAYIYGFFRLCQTPFIEKLFIQLPKGPEDPQEIRSVPEPSDITFNHLKAIKLSNFKGGMSEMRLVRFLLERAVVLETMVLVAPPKADLKESINHEQYNSASEAISQDNVDLMVLRGQLSLLPKTSRANIVLCEYLEDDKALAPKHTEYFTDF